MIELKYVAHYVSDKIDVSSLRPAEYVTTDNMIPNRGGISEGDSLPQATRVTKYIPGDILVSNIRPYFKKIWFSTRVSGCSNDVIVFRTNSENWDKKFLYYVLSQDVFFDFMMTGSNGTKMPRGNKKLIPNFLVPDFDVKKQRRIAGVLSTYDDLIENNQKQIKLLEEAAQRLYKEWFVDFRFPGYENTPIVDGLPEGWKLKELGSIFDFVRGKSYKSSELSETQGVLFLNLKSIRPYGGYNRNAEKRFTGKYNKNQSLYPGDIIMSVTDMTKERRLVGQVAIVPNLKEEMTFSMDLIKLDPKCLLKSYLYSTFFYGGFSNTLSPFANGVNVLHLKPESIMKLRMLVPTLEIMQAYDRFFTSINTKIELLEDQTNIAKSARDLLLPKLMSGEIEV